jgi:aspartyl-tRNA(Asn)/glutamyl-tRNA(Gln) amidotransferase subunit C
MLTTDQVKHIAKLAALEISDDSIEQTKTELNDILAYVEQLSAVETEGVPETSHAHGSEGVFRDDVIRPSFPRETVAEQAPDFDERGFRVPRVL